MDKVCKLFFRKKSSKTIYSSAIFATAFDDASINTTNGSTDTVNNTVVVTNMRSLFVAPMPLFTSTSLRYKVR